jgi:3-deoxy-D-manno-octulosonate 8-phosphate phosphatase (KDO 8-P phosphatase)
MTDGRIRFDDAGRQSREFHIQDGLGIALWHGVGRQVGVLTSKQSGAVAARAKMLGIDLLEQGKENKVPGFERILAKAQVTAEETAFVGDDLLDATVMRQVGYPIAVANAVDEIKGIASYVTKRPGGDGAVREAIEHLLKRENLWPQALEAIGADG